MNIKKKKRFREVLLRPKLRYLPGDSLVNWVSVCLFDFKKSIDEKETRFAAHLLCIWAGGLMNWEQMRLALPPAPSRTRTLRAPLKHDY